ncbi:HK97-gp10 family putative phage morphogenesis protein [Teichococcus deserti]|uniref:HK97-gp10 family putative phage morphogenesis protein n=1 Tax=Teichococcus deserti TaxID=1817963 RepID=UPI00105448A7|nr:HK97-gp10 family putative phage morphogenesis protein [Pseudoroseomonas deserti]
MANNLAQFAAMLAAIENTIQDEMQRATEQGAQIVEREMKSELGTQQGPVAHLPAWAPVKSNPNSPLLLTGDMKKSIGTQVGDNEAFIGTNDEKAVHLEFGTSKMPPRSFVERALVVSEPKIADMMTRRIIRAFKRIG